MTCWCNNLNLAGKRPVRIKSPRTQIQYLWEVPGFRSAGHKRFQPDFMVQWSHSPYEAL